MAIVVTSVDEAPVFVDVVKVEADVEATAIIIHVELPVPAARQAALQKSGSLNPANGKLVFHKFRTYPAHQPVSKPQLSPLQTAGVVVVRLADVVVVARSDVVVENVGDAIRVLPTVLDDELVVLESDVVDPSFWAVLRNVVVVVVVVGIMVACVVVSMLDVLEEAESVPESVIDDPIVLDV